MPSEDTIERIVAFAGKLHGIDPQVLREGLETAHLHHQIERVVEEHLAHWGVTARQFEVMESLYHKPDGAMTPAALSEEVGLTRSAMTNALDCLATSGHIVRMPHPTDRRMVSICLTPSGRKFIGQRLPERYQQFHRIIASLSKKQRDIYLETNRMVLDLLKREMAEERRREAASAPPAAPGAEGF